MRVAPGPILLALLAGCAATPPPAAEGPACAHAPLPYRLRLDIEGEREVQRAEEPAPSRVREMIHLEIEYSEEPAPAGSDAPTWIVLEALHYRLRRSDPRVDRRIDAADDRLVIRDGDEVVLDLEGPAPRAALKPGMLLGRRVAGVRDGTGGDPPAVFVGGEPLARELLQSLPVREGLAWVRPARPPPGAGPGATWSAQRFPASHVGQLGLLLELDHEITAWGDAGFAEVRIAGRREGSDVASARGFAFDRVRAEVTGEATIDPRSGRPTRLLLDDDVRVAYRRRRRGGEVEYRLRYRTTSALTLRADAAAPEALRACAAP